MAEDFNDRSSAGDFHPGDTYTEIAEGGDFHFDFLMVIEGVRVEFFWFLHGFSGIELSSLFLRGARLGRRGRRFDRDAGRTVGLAGGLLAGRGFFAFGHLGIGRQLDIVNRCTKRVAGATGRGGLKLLNLPGFLEQGLGLGVGFGLCFTGSLFGNCFLGGLFDRL